MDTTQPSNNMSHENNNGSIESICIGFVLALGNHVFNWFGSIFGQVQPPTLLGAMGQALVTGAIGAAGAFFMSKLLKYISKKYFNKNKHTP